jgi:RHS repeat-associated protein
LSLDGPQPGSQDTTVYAYAPSSGDLLAVTRPLVGTISYSDYDGAGQVGRITDENGNATVFTYDGRRRIKTVASASDGSVTTYNYSTTGEPDQVIAANGVTTEFEYDATYGRLTRMLDPLGNYMSYAYDTQGNRIEQSIYNPSAQRVFWKRFDYQSPQNPGKLWKVINPDNTYSEYSYFAGGNIASIKDPEDKVTYYDYDVLNRLTVVIQPGNVSTLYGYDPSDNLKNVTDAEGHSTLYTYDDRGRLLSTASPDTGVTTYTSDISGNLISKTNANGITTTYTYDTLNRLTGMIYPDSAQNVTYTYDEGPNGKGRLSGMSDPSGDTANTYDARGNLITETRTISGEVYRTSYTYDAAGTLTGMTYPDGRSVTYDLDSAGRVSRVTTAKDGITRTLAENISYIPFGPVSGLTYGNGLNQALGFDLLYRPANISAGSVYSVDFTKDAAGNITAITDNLNPLKSQTFGYDDLYRITDATGVFGTMTYAYDNVGNRLTRTHDGTTESYAYVPGTSLLSDVNGTAFGYDTNGNTIVKGTQSFNYNQNNRLVRVAENGMVSGEYVYNALGQRVIKRTGGETMVYLHNFQGNLVAEAESDGTIIAEYFYLNGSRLAVIRADNKIEAVIDIDPDTLTLNSKGNWITTYIELPEGYDANDIDSQSISLNATVYAVKSDIGDYDQDGIPDLMVKFDRGQVCDILNTGDAVEITIEGEGDGFGFFGVDQIRVIDKGQKKNKSFLFYDFSGEAIDDSPVVLSAELNVDPDLIISADTPSEYKPEPVLLASLFDISGILARSVVANTGNGEAVYYYINDHLATPQMLVDESGAVVWQADFLPFGEAVVNIDAVGNGFRFPGQYHDSETGLHYNYYRYYDPRTGRFSTPDPIGLAGGINLFPYVLNNPINLTDVLGLFLDDAFSPSPSQVYGDMWMQQYGNQGPQEFKEALDKTAPLVFKTTAITIGITVGMHTTPATGATVYSLIDGFFNLAQDKPIGLGWWSFHIEIINPLEAHAPEIFEDLCK